MSGDMLRWMSMAWTRAIEAMAAQADSELMNLYMGLTMAEAKEMAGAKGLDEVKRQVEAVLVRRFGHHGRLDVAEVDTSPYIMPRLQGGRMIPETIYLNETFRVHTSAGRFKVEVGHSDHRGLVLYRITREA